MSRYTHTTQRRGPSAGFIGAAIGIVIAMGVMVGIVALAGGTWSKTEANEVTCVYNGGPIDSSEFKGHTDPGNGRQYQGFMSQTVDVPTAVRQYRVSLNPEQGDTPGPDSVNVRVRGYSMTFEPTVAFTINTALEDVDGKGKPIACTFIEQQIQQFAGSIGDIDFNDSDGAWSKWLNERLRPVLDDSATRVLQSGYDPGDLKFNNDGVRDEAAVAIAVDLQRKINDQFGKDFLCASSNSAFEEKCGTVSVILPAPSLDEADETQLAKPQRARIDANNSIAAADEQAREAEGVAGAREDEALFAEQRADAEEEIAQQNGRTADATATIDYAWCEYLAGLGQDCALVKAAENGDFPSVITSTTPAIAIPVPIEEASANG